MSTGRSEIPMSGDLEARCLLPAMSMAGDAWGAESKAGMACDTILARDRNTLGVSGEGWLL